MDKPKLEDIAITGKTEKAANQALTKLLPYGRDEAKYEKLTVFPATPLPNGHYAAAAQYQLKAGDNPNATKAGTGSYAGIIDQRAAARNRSL